MTLQPTPDSPLDDAPAPEVTPKAAEALAALEKDDRLTANDVVDAAADPTSPLHDYFDWDDTSAASKFRLHQARRLIRSVEVQVTTVSRTVSAVAYVRDPSADPKEQGYIATTKVREDPDAARAVLRGELKRIQGMGQRVQDLAAALGLLKDTDSLLALVDGMIDELQPEVAAE